jgi:hypothetical protein
MVVNSNPRIELEASVRRAKEALTGYKRTSLSIIVRGRSEVSRRLKVALVRELEIAYSSGATIRFVKYASPYRWANACQDLFETGRLDILDYAVYQLHAIYPDLTYLATLRALFDAMPRQVPSPLAFCDDPTAEIQIVRRPGCENVLLCFCAGQATLGLPVNFVHQWLGRLPTSLVYIKDFRELSGGCGFPTLGPDRASAVVAFRRIAGDIGAKRIYTFGVSLGGYPALYYGLKLGAEAVLSLGGATDLTPDFVETLGRFQKEYLNLREVAPDYTKNLRECYVSAQNKPRLLIAYSTRNPRDRQQAEQMEGLQNVELFAVDHAHHNVIDPLIREGKLKPLLDRLLSNDTSQSSAATIAPTR